MKIIHFKKIEAICKKYFSESKHWSGAKDSGVNIIGSDNKPVASLSYCQQSDSIIIRANHSSNHISDLSRLAKEIEKEFTCAPFRKKFSSKKPRGVILM